MESVLEIRDGICSGRDRESTLLQLPVGVVRIADFALMGSPVLREVYLPEGLEHIGWYAFSDCSRLERLHLPSTLREIEDHAFDDCDALLYLENRSKLPLLHRFPHVRRGYVGGEPVEILRGEVLFRALCCYLTRTEPYPPNWEICFQRRKDRLSYPLLRYIGQKQDAEALSALLEMAAVARPVLEKAALETDWTEGRACILEYLGQRAGCRDWLDSLTDKL